jgi:signal transduction histidine kinase
MMDMDPSAVIGLSFNDAFARMFGKRAAEYYLADNHGASTVVEIQNEVGRRFLVSIFLIQQTDRTPISVVTWNDVTRLSRCRISWAGPGGWRAWVSWLRVSRTRSIILWPQLPPVPKRIMRDLNNPERLRVSGSTQWNYYLEEIVRQSLRCKEITHGLLDLTRQRTAKRVLCNLNSLAKDCARVALQRGGLSAEVKINLDKGVGQVATDAEMVRQILDNLLNNAVDALNGQKGTVTVSTRRDGEQIIIEIADTGSGVPSDVLTKIFDPFFSTKGPGKGYGLGLAISLTLAESLGGGINVTSKTGEGCVFRLWLPRRAPEA